MESKNPELKDQLEETVQAFMSGLPEADAQLTAKSFEKLQASDTGCSAINTGDTAPDFELPNATGGTVRLTEALDKGPVILNFYRGGWCPFCNLELQALQSRMQEIKKLGATLIGISPETPDNSLTTAEKHQLDFDVLSDLGNKTARDYGLIFTVYEEMRPLYLNWGLNLPAFNGDNSWELPVPATYLVDRERVVRAAYVDKDYTKRMEPDLVLAALRSLAV